MLSCHPVKLQAFFREARQPVWKSKVQREEESKEDLVKYGIFDYSQFGELELRMYILIKARLASMYELQYVYTLDEALKLYALYQMELDIEKGHVDEMKRGGHSR